MLCSRVKWTDYESNMIETVEEKYETSEVSKKLSPNPKNLATPPEDSHYFLSNLIENPTTNNSKSSIKLKTKNI